MSELNVEAEIRIAEFVDEWANDGRSVEETLREAMRWAYADAARVCSDNADKVTRDKAWAEGIASLDCRKAILARASNPGGA